MTRREFFSIVPVAGLGSAFSQAPLIVPVNHVLDSRAKWSPWQIRDFWYHMWPEAVRDFASCGIQLQSSVNAGEIWRPPGRQPVVSGLVPGALNVVVTDQVPVEWDNGMALGGVTTRYRGYHLCMVALNNAHGHQIPLLSVNTCVHELLHALLLDIFESRPKGVPGQAREFRIDWYATRMWLFHDGATIRRTAEAYVERLRSDCARRAG